MAISIQEAFNEKFDRESKKIFEAKLYWNHQMTNMQLSLVYVLLIKVILYLSLIIYSLVECQEYLYSSKLLFVKARSDLVLNNTWVS